MQTQTAPWDVIAEIEQDNSRTYKEAIVQREALKGNTEFFAGCNLAFNAMVTFGVKQVPEKTDADGAGITWDSFSLAVTGLVNRTVTGNTARDMIHTMMKSATREQWNGWYRRILIKDMRAGFSESTINKVVTKANQDHYAIPVFSCQLAHDSANHENKVCGQKLIEVKLDGVRVISVVYPDGRVNQYSRNGKELVNFPHVKDQLSILAQTLDRPMVFDGEIMSGTFQDLMKQIHRKHTTPANDAVLNLFDMLPLEAFERGEYNMSQTDRSAQLRKVVQGEALLVLATPNITMVEQELVDLDTAEGYARYKEINAMAVSGGYEGIMLKDPDAPYQCKRTTAWLKLKPFIEVSLAVIGLEEGTGKNAGKLGAFICEGTDDGKLIRVNVGSGFSDTQREDYFTDEVIGEIVEVRADAVTRNQDGSYSLRFPRFRHFRGFEPGEKL